MLLHDGRPQLPADRAVAAQGRGVERRALEQVLGQQARLAMGGSVILQTQLSIFSY